MALLAALTGWDYINARLLIEKPECVSPRITQLHTIAYNFFIIMSMVSVL